MTKENAIRIFEEKKVRSVWDSEVEKWYISIIDVIEVLTESVDPSSYWRKLKQRLKEEGNETVTNCHGLKMKAADGKMRLTNIAPFGHTLLTTEILQINLTFIKKVYFIIKIASNIIGL